MKPVERPVYLDLRRIHLPLPGWVSILHRVSGVLLFAALPLGVWGLSVSLSSAAGFEQMRGVMHHPLSKLLLLVMTWLSAHHLLAGLRHLAMDLHAGVGLRRARQISAAVLLGGAAVALLAAWRLFA